MKILIIRPMANEININSYNCQEVGLAKGFIDLGCDCDILFFSNYERSIKIEYHNKTIQVFYKSGFVKYKINGIFNNLDELIGRYDLVQVNEVTQLQTIKLLLESKYKDKIYVYHGPYDNRFDSFKHKLFNIYFENKIKRIYAKQHFCNKVFTKSILASKYLNKLGIESINIGVGLDLTNLITCCATNYNPYELLYIGKIEPRRNILFIIDVFRKLLELDERYHLTIIGSGEKAYVKKVEKKINNYNLKGKITSIEKVEQKELYQYYIKSGVFLLPSNYEIFGMVILESLYYGLPVITTLNGGSSVLQHGVYVNSLEVDAWCNTIHKISKNYDLINHNDLTTYIIDNFVWKKLANNILKEFKI